MAMVERYFVTEYRRGYGHEKISRGFRTREMAEIERRAIIQNPDNKDKCIMISRYKVNAEEVPKQYNVFPEYEVRERRIYEAYEEYRRNEQWN